MAFRAITPDRPLFAPHGQPLTHQHLRVPAADRLHVEKPVVVDVLNDQADLVAMAGQHHSKRGVRVSHGDQVAVQIAADSSAKCRRIFADDLLQAGLIARWTGRVKIVCKNSRAFVSMDRTSPVGRKPKPVSRFQASRVLRPPGPVLLLSSGAESCHHASRDIKPHGGA